MQISSDPSLRREANSPEEFKYEDDDEVEEEEDDEEEYEEDEEECEEDEEEGSVEAEDEESVEDESSEEESGEVRAAFCRWMYCGASTLWLKLKQHQKLTSMTMAKLSGPRKMLRMIPTTGNYGKIRQQPYFVKHQITGTFESEKKIT